MNVFLDRFTDIPCQNIKNIAFSGCRCIKDNQVGLDFKSQNSTKFYQSLVLLNRMLSHFNQKISTLQEFISDSHYHQHKYPFSQNYICRYIKIFFIQFTMGIIVVRIRRNRNDEQPDLQHYLRIANAHFNALIDQIIICDHNNGFYGIRVVGPQLTPQIAIGIILFIALLYFGVQLIQICLTEALPVDRFLSFVTYILDGLLAGIINFMDMIGQASHFILCFIAELFMARPHYMCHTDFEPKIMTFAG